MLESSGSRASKFSPVHDMDEASQDKEKSSDDSLQDEFELEQDKK